MYDTITFLVYSLKTITSCDWDSLYFMHVCALFSSHTENEASNVWGIHHVTL